MKRTVELTRLYHFSAAHQLLNPALSPRDNADLYGPCARPHGHNYYLEVTVAGVHVFRVEGVQIVEHWAYENLWTLAALLPDAPPPAPPITRRLAGIW